MSIEKKVLNTIRKFNLVQSGESIIVGVSGGPDSVCLLHVLHTLIGELNINNIYAVHINHMLRGDESRLDEEYVVDLCEKLGIRLFSKSFDIKAISRGKSISIEEAGREVRYGQFEAVSAEVGAEKIAVAHNRNDQAETVLMHIIRGAGLEGLQGMEFRRGRIIRPLMEIERSDIEKYCSEKRLNPRTDSSNLKNIYTRNKVRLDLIPFIDNLFKTDITDKLVKASVLLRDDNNYINANVSRIFDQCVISRSRQDIQLDISAINSQHPAIKKRLVRNAVREVKGDLKGIENIHIEGTIAVIQSGKTGIEIHLPFNIRVRKSYNILRIFLHNGSEQVDTAFDRSLNVPGQTVGENQDTFIKAEIEEMIKDKDYNKDAQYSLAKYFDYEKLKTGISIRTRKEGDIFKPYKSNGTKKLKEYFIDNKIPKEERARIPVIAKGNEIVWIIGHKISDKFKVTENTKSILKLEYIKLSEENT
ncbi:MAG: tRNA lysidine(34) synthetase TilS [Clostridia bacterium]|nr:tRNA lysidine(34) synthetase TilS [Clostridia bacterium]